MGESSGHLSQLNDNIINRRFKLDSNESIEELRNYLSEKIGSKQSLIGSNRIKLSLSRGIWKSDERVVEITVSKNINHCMGFTVKSIKYLAPEEALFMMECESIDVLHEDIPLSIEDAFELFFRNSDEIDCYRVYALLSRFGYFVKRHQKLETINESVEQSVDSVVNNKRKFIDENNESVNDCVKHFPTETNYYELCSEISNYKSITNVRPLSRQLLPKNLALNKFLNESHEELSSDEQSLTYDKSIIYNIEDNNESVELDNRLVLFKGKIKPLCSLGSIMTSSELYDTIKTFGPKTSQPMVKYDSDLDFDLDVFKPDCKSSDSPLFHVIVTNVTQPVPQFKDIIHLKNKSNGNQFYFAVIDSGDVNFYCLSHFDLKDQFPTLWESGFKP